jgi:CrcB protein
VPHSELPVVAAVASGGALGALARYGISAAWPHDPGQFPWSTWTINMTGCFLIGVLMVVVTRRSTHPLLRPFVGVGVLGGYTTFSTWAVDVQRAPARTALLILAATVLGALLAVWAGSALTATVVRHR